MYYLVERMMMFGLASYSVSLLDWADLIKCFQLGKLLNFSTIVGAKT